LERGKDAQGGLGHGCRAVRFHRFQRSIGSHHLGA
jgi:hypothetical protein